jgi:hypothetical protein
MNEPATIFSLIHITITLITAYFCFHLAKKRSRNPLLWAGLAFLPIVGFASMVILFLLPPQKKKRTKPVKETSGIAPAIHSESAALNNDESFDTPRVPRLPGSKSLTWYFIDTTIESEIKGPFSLNELRKQVVEHKLDETTLVWCEEFEEWAPISKFSNSSLIMDQDFIE